MRLLQAFDGFLVLFGWVMTITQVPGGTQIARVLRVGRLVRVLRQAPALRVVFTTLVVSFGSLINTTVVVSLFMYMFAIVGIELYGPLNADRETSAEWSQPWPLAVDVFSLSAGMPANSSVVMEAAAFAASHVPNEGFNRHVHFRTVGRAMLTLFRVLTGMCHSVCVL